MIYYFGCQYEAGHYWFTPNSKLSYGDICKLPQEITSKIDGGFYNNKLYKVGLARITHICDHTILAFEDHSVDHRPASNSAFVIDQIVDFPTAIELCKAEYPNIFIRYDFPIVLE